MFVKVDRMTARSTWHRPYDTALRNHLRHHELALHPLCEGCIHSEEVTEATVVNHRVPRKGMLELFSNLDNLESVCKPHHDDLIQRDRTYQVITRQSLTAGSSQGAELLSAAPRS